jgi:hypothetical protein
MAFAIYKVGSLFDICIGFPNNPSCNRKRIILVRRLVMPMPQQLGA